MENDIPTSAQGSGERENKPRLLHVGEEVTVDAPGQNPLLEYEVYEVMEVSEQYILKPINRIDGSENEGLKVFSFNVVKPAAVSEPKGGWRRPLMDIVRPSRDETHQKKSNKFVPEVERPLDPRFEAIVDVQTDAIVAETYQSPEHVQHSPEIEARLPEITEEIGETGVNGTALEEDASEESPFELRVGRPDAEVKKIPIFETEVVDSAKDIIEVHTKPEIDAEPISELADEEVNSEVKVEETPSQEKEEGVKNDLFKEVNIASEKLNERVGMDAKLEVLHRSVIHMTEEVRALKSYDDPEAFRRVAAELEARLYEKGTEAALYTNDDVNVLYSQIDELRNALADQKEKADKADKEAVKNTADTLRPFTHDILGILGHVEESNRQFTRDLADASLRLQKVISDSYRSDVDIHEIEAIAKELERKYNPDAGHNAELFNGLRKDIDKATAAIAKAKLTQE